MTGTQPVFATTEGREAFIDAVIDLGILREFPNPEPDWQDPTTPCAIPDSPRGNRGWMLYYPNYAGTTAPDFGMYLYCVSEPLCRKFNEINTSLGNAIGGNHGDAELYGGRICTAYPYTPPDDSHLIVALGEVN